MKSLNELGMWICASACGNLVYLTPWWDHLADAGPNYGHQPNFSKTWLIVKEGKSDDVIATFKLTGVHFTREGKGYSGAGLGTRSSTESYVQWIMLNK